MEHSRSPVQILVNQMDCKLDSSRSKSSSNQSKIQQFLELNLRLQNLKVIAESFFTKSHFLRAIDIRNNQIKKLPDSICALSILWKLRVDFNLLEDLPRDLGNLERLEIFSASNNKITYLPESISKLGDRLGIL
jgi:leucine-rich repeat protein SHOC2